MPACPSWPCHSPRLLPAALPPVCGTRRGQAGPSGASTAKEAGCQHCLEQQQGEASRTEHAGRLAGRERGGQGSGQGGDGEGWPTCPAWPLRHQGHGDASRPSARAAAARPHIAHNFFFPARRRFAQKLLKLLLCGGPWRLPRLCHSRSYGNPLTEATEEEEEEGFFFGFPLPG